MQKNMKKLTAILTALAMTCCLVPVYRVNSPETIQATAATENTTTILFAGVNLTFSLNDSDHTAKLTGVSKTWQSNNEVVIPPTFTVEREILGKTYTTEYTVTDIDENTFHNYYWGVETKDTTTRKITIPGTIKVFPRFWCLYKMTALEEVVFEEGVEELPNYSINQCANVKAITIPRSVTNIGDYIWANGSEGKYTGAILGYRGTLAEQFANARGYLFIPLDEEEETTTEPPVTTTEPPVTTTEAPVTTTEPPVTTTEAPASTSSSGYSNAYTGDINSDGKTDSADMAYLLAYLKGNQEFTEQECYAADVTQDGYVNEDDYAWIYLYITGLRDGSDTSITEYYYDLTDYAEYPATLYGDGNLDEKVDMDDYYILLQSLNISEYEITLQAVLNLDVNADNCVNAEDTRILLSYLNGWLDSIPYSAGTPSTTEATTATTTATTTTTTTTATVPVITEPELEVTENRITLAPGEQYTIQANQQNLTYISNHPEIAAVSKKGIITALTDGSAVITVMNAEYDAVQIYVTVAADTVSASPGDVTGDENIDIMDVIMINKAVFGKVSLSDAQQKAADVDKNGTVDATDSLMIMKYIVKLITAFD